MTRATRAGEGVARQPATASEEPGKLNLFQVLSSSQQLLACAPPPALNDVMALQCHAVRRLSSLTAPSLGNRIAADVSSCVAVTNKGQVS